jgi:3-hydroxyacyl-[acyl-carrier-protein] dehydratase
MQMLLNDFYRIIEEKKSEEAIPDGILKHLFYRIELNGAHSIFGGHFPGNPVVPGVCQVEMIRELLVRESGVDLILSGADNIKFLAMISPSVNPQVGVYLEVKEKAEQMTIVSGSIENDEIIFLKFRGTFKPH